MSFVTIVLCASPLAFAHAQDISRDEVIQVAPQFMTALVTMQHSLGYIETRMVNENNALRAMNVVLGNSATKLSYVQEPLSSADQAVVRQVETELQSIKTGVSDIATRRDATQGVLKSIIETLGAISNIFVNAL